MTEILKGLEDLNPIPSTAYARKMVAILKAAGIGYLDIRDDGKQIVVLAECGDGWHGWVAYTYEYLDCHRLDELVSDLWDWRETDFSQITLKAD